MSRKFLFLTLRTFSKTGGIEQVSKVAGKAIYETCKELGDELKIFSMYDQTSDADTRYFPQSIFKGFRILKLRFVVRSVQYGMKSDVIILSHINLLLAGYLIKLLSPKTKLILIAHGIEVWEKFSAAKKKMLMTCDQILSVSEFTKKTLIRMNKLPDNKIRVLNNCIDPFLREPVKTGKSAQLLKRYGFQQDDLILMTLTRLAAKERYKGYDIVIESLHHLRKNDHNLKYLIVGNYDDAEKKRLDKIIAAFDLTECVVFAGFIPEEELAEHFNMADIYIMPSKKEGFGIVFIEAMYYNKPVIAGNKDGSVDALLNGKLGLLVNPKSKEEVSVAIKRVICNKKEYLPDHQLLMEHFGFSVYKQKWKEVLGSINN